MPVFSCIFVHQSRRILVYRYFSGFSYTPKTVWLLFSRQQRQPCGWAGLWDVFFLRMTNDIGVQERALDSGRLHHQRFPLRICGHHSGVSRRRCRDRGSAHHVVVIALVFVRFGATGVIADASGIHGSLRFTPNIRALAWGFVSGASPRRDGEGNAAR